MAPVQCGDDYCARMCADLRRAGFWRDVFAELFATFLFVTVNLLLLVTWEEGASPSVFQVSLGVGFFVIAMGYGLGDFGGAHMNPAVTLAFMIRGEVSVIKGVIYWVVQVGSGIAAAFFVFVIIPEGAFVEGVFNALPEGAVVWKAGVFEAVGTMVVCLAAVATCNISRKGYVILPSLPIGFAYILGLFITIPATSGSLNPARTLGPFIVAAIDAPDVLLPIFKETQWIFIVGPFVGALLAGIFYWIFDSVERPKTPIYDNTNTWNYNKSHGPEVLNGGGYN